MGCLCSIIYDTGVRCQKWDIDKSILIRTMRKDGTDENHIL